MRRNTEDIIIVIVDAIQKIKASGKTETSLAEISSRTDLPNVVVVRYIPVFTRLGKMKVTEVLSDRGVERKIDISKFDLEIN